MKQLKKTLLTLVALLAVTTGATAQTGYNGAALPAGPDMSGSVINVTAANAQYVLDGAYGDITGKTINFTENVTSLLDLARPTKYAGSGTTVSGTTYTRTLSNVTFTANSGVTLAGFYCTAGATNWSVNKDVMYLNNVYNYVTDGNGNYTSIKTVSNVTFDGLTINAPSGTLSAVFAFGKPGYLTMDGITFTNCTITNSNGHGLYFCSLDQDCMQYGAISITNSIIQGTASDRSGVIIEGVGYSNTVITNNYIVGYHNAIQIENPGNGGSQPQSVTITGNFLKSNNKYPVNLYQLTSNMFTFTGNVVVAGASGQHVGHFHGNASGNLWAANGSAPDANGRITTTLTAPALYGNDNDVTSTSYYSTAVVNTSSDIWVKFDVTGVTLSQTEASLTVGNTVRLTPTLAPEGQTDQTVTWATSDAAVATVSNEGVVTAVGAGTATITVTATNGTDVTTDDQTATCTVTVAGTPVAIDWTEATKTASIDKMPAGNVTVSVDYFPQAEFATRAGETPELLAPAAIANVPANTDAPIVTPGTVANIGTSEVKQGTLMYFVSQSTDNTVPDTPDYDDERWTDKVPTANELKQGDVYVWYYIKGAEPDNIADRSDDNTRSDSDIMPLGANGIVTLDPEPTYDVTLNAEGLSDEEAAAWQVAKGTDDPAAFPLEGVKKSETVTVTYTGSKKIIGVKAEPAKEPVTLATPLTIEALTAGTIQVNITDNVYDPTTLQTGMKYSKDGGKTKKLITQSEDIPVAKGDKVQFYGNGTQTQAYYIQNGVRVSINGSGEGFQTKVYGNIMSLLNETGFATNTELPNNDNVFTGLFYNNLTLSDASELLLPATELTVNCYYCMFQACQLLTAAPKLPAMTLAPSCYEGMFLYCTSLTTAPKLPATTLAAGCYGGMFFGCTNLTNAYVKAAYTDSDDECDRMFEGCSATGAVLHTTSGNKASWEAMMGTGKEWETWTVDDDWQE